MLFLYFLGVLYVYGLLYIKVFICLLLPRLVPNQRQLFIVVSDWGPYLGSHIPWVFRGLLSV